MSVAGTTEVPVRTMPLQMMASQVFPPTATECQQPADPRAMPWLGLQTPAHQATLGESQNGNNPQLQVSATPQMTSTSTSSTSSNEPAVSEDEEPGAAPLFHTDVHAWLAQYAAHIPSDTSDSDEEEAAATGWLHANHPAPAAAADVIVISDDEDEE